MQMTILAQKLYNLNARSKCSAIKLEVTERPSGKGKKHKHPRLGETYRGARKNLRRVMRVAQLNAKRNARKPETVASS